MKTVLILNFGAFSGRKDPNKFYYSFDMFDIEEKRIYHIVQESAYTEIPNGEVPSKEDCVKTFPRKATVDFSFDQYRNKEGQIVYQPKVKSISSWKYVDLTKI